MPTSRSGAATLRLGVVALMIAAAASVWELLALQAPGTTLYIAMLPGPITTLRELATALGVLLVLAGMTMPWACRGRPEPRRLVIALYAGTLLALGAQTYGATQGMTGIQLGDLRADALPLFVVKHGGLGVVFGALCVLGRRVLVQPAPLPDRQLDHGKPDH
jgi:predicted benzoate:H+ symporter BenE